MFHFESGINFFDMMFGHYYQTLNKPFAIDLSQMHLMIFKPRKIFSLQAVPGTIDLSEMHSMIFKPRTDIYPASCALQCRSCGKGGIEISLHHLHENKIFSCVHCRDNRANFLVMCDQSRSADNVHINCYSIKRGRGRLARW